MTGGGTYQKVTAEQNRASAMAEFRRETENLKNLYKERNKELEPYTKIISKGDPLATSSPETVAPKSNYKTDFGSSTSSKGNNSTEKAENKMLKEGEKAIDIAKQIELQKQEALAE